MKLKMSIAGKEDLPEIIKMLTLYNGKFDNFMHGMPSYKPKDIYDFLAVQCNVYVGIANNTVEGVFIYQWMKKISTGERIVKLHICTMNNKFNWHKFYKDQIRPDISKYTDYELGELKKEDRALMRLYRKYGYNFTWSEENNSFIYLQKL